jgi:hypothetical protein
VVGSIHPEGKQLLPAGDYEVEVVDGAPELRGFHKRISVAAGARVVVDVRLEGISVRNESAGSPPPPPPRGKE